MYLGYKDRLQRGGLVGDKFCDFQSLETFIIAGRLRQRYDTPAAGANLARVSETVPF